MWHNQGSGTPLSRPPPRWLRSSLPAPPWMLQPAPVQSLSSEKYQPTMFSLPSPGSAVDCAPNLFLLLHPCPNALDIRHHIAVGVSKTMGFDYTLARVIGGRHKPQISVKLAIQSSQIPDSARDVLLYVAAVLHAESLC